ncbi:bifunctional tetrahydrofolate synthase/dihydrofolate synthase [Pseudomaricurvus alkylphenolicus]|uniref:bifunctional tetrahydrofolate synthase/dihydrofolate synthase n=1 Tax=Pseudomaricurvus alkylphenolicus TaxID=1306991 RepID=UPI00141E394F|nr:bifunctional tetrahydrofolate synthase/dihydrofolate synthase [Pseudomaricurvus alkylphenolicus]NIB41327.1 bifunctional tetrahydrofolate synthase/dihydrofolate synthase [Pseudomaricurvus alkylphenolicus]
MRFSQLQDWLSWQETLHSSEIDMGLERVRAVAERMGLLQPEAKVVSVAGTNGKGSCVATLELLCRQRGDKVGAFTSPHLLHYNERIRVDGQSVEDALICESFERIDQARGDISLTYFEFGTLAAIDIFQQLNVDVMLLEVGLGGRLDAVNILDADVAVVTSIDLDHQDWLGSDINVIGREKAGIYRPNRWAICADLGAPETVADYAHEIGALWVAMGMSMNMEQHSGHWDFSGVTSEGEPLELYHLPLPRLPLVSVAAALQAFALLDGHLDDEVAKVMTQLELPGRAQHINVHGVEYILDVAHNPAAAALLAEHLGSLEPATTHAITAIMADKDRQGVLKPLLSQVTHWHVAELSHIPRAATADQLLGDFTELGVDAGRHGDVASAIANTNAVAGDRVVIMGSFFTVAEAMAVLGGQVSG